MSDASGDARGDPNIATYVCDAAGRVTRVEPLTEEQWQELRAQLAACEARSRYGFEHDAAARLYRLTAPDGTVERFRDHPTRHLCVEPDAETGQMRPVIQRGRPVYLWLCREEREAR